MRNESVDERDILEKLMDFERCGLTPGTRVGLRECAAVEIFKLRQEVEQLRKEGAAGGNGST